MFRKNVQFESSSNIYSLIYGFLLGPKYGHALQLWPGIVRILLRILGYGHFHAPKVFTIVHFCTFVNLFLAYKSGHHSYLVAETYILTVDVGGSQISKTSIYLVNSPLGFDTFVWKFYILVIVLSQFWHFV